MSLSHSSRPQTRPGDAYSSDYRPGQASIDPQPLKEVDSGGCRTILCKAQSAKSKGSSSDR